MCCDDFFLLSLESMQNKEYRTGKGYLIFMPGKLILEPGVGSCLDHLPDGRGEIHLISWTGPSLMGDMGG